MADTDALRVYRRGSPPTLPNGDKLYLDNELSKLTEIIAANNAVIKKLEARIAALEP